MGMGLGFCYRGNTEVLRVLGLARRLEFNQDVRN